MRIVINIPPEWLKRRCSRVTWRSVVWAAWYIATIGTVVEAVLFMHNTTLGKDATVWQFGGGWLLFWGALSLWHHAATHFFPHRQETTKETA